MKTVQVSAPGSEFVVTDRDMPDPGAGSVRVKVGACGICHSDALVKEGIWPNVSYPRVPGHEVAGVIDGVGPGVAEWGPGDRVGIG